MSVLNNLNTFRKYIFLIKILLYLFFFDLLNFRGYENDQITLHYLVSPINN